MSSCSSLGKEVGVAGGNQRTGEDMGKKMAAPHSCHVSPKTGSSGLWAGKGPSPVEYKFVLLRCGRSGERRWPTPWEMQPCLQAAAVGGADADIDPALVLIDVGGHEARKGRGCIDGVGNVDAWGHRWRVSVVQPTALKDRALYACEFTMPSDNQQRIPIEQMPHHWRCC